MNQYVGTAPSTFQVLYRDLFFFCRLHLVPAGTGHNFRSKVCYYACNPWVCHHFSEKLKGKSKRKQLLASMLICSKYKNANPPHLEENIFRNGCKPNTQVHPVRRTFAKAVRASALSTKASTAPPSSVPQKRWSFSLQRGGPYC